MNKISIFIGRALLAPVSRIPLSRLYGRLTRLRRPRFLARAMVRRFRKHYGIAMDEFQGTAADYRSLSDFFLRPLDRSKRPLAKDPASLLSPADGLLSGLELVQGDAATQVKGWTYSLGRLLAIPVAAADRWHVATIYLSPRDYHRFHYPVAARISGSFHGGCRLFPVNEFSVKRVKDLYLRNERVVTRFELPGGPLYLAAVGATFVGSIAMAHLPRGSARSGRWQDLDLAAEQMAEMGWFAMGSTIILAVPARLVAAVLAKKGEQLRVGQPLFKIKS